MLPAVALVPSKNMKLPLPPELASTKFWVSPELFVMPVPCMVRAKGAATVIVKELRLLNVMLATVVSAEIPTEVVLDRPKVAVSVVALGTVPDDQFVPVFQSPEPGLASHVPLAAKVVLRAETKSNVTIKRQKMRVVFWGS